MFSRRESGYSSPANTPSSVHGGGMEVFDFPESVRYNIDVTLYILYQHLTIPAMESRAPYNTPPGAQDTHLLGKTSG